MAAINENYLKLKAGYLFPEIGRRVKAFCEAHPDAPVIRLGIGDVTEPLPAAVREAMHQAVDEMGTRETFRGYGPEQGYDFLRSAVAEQDYHKRGVHVSPDEIFISDGSKCDTGNILDIFGRNNKVAITDPVYPVYVDTNVMDGRTGEADANGRYAGVVYLPVTAENNFIPPLPQERVDLIYLCYPNNPTGTVASQETLKTWVDYARENQAILLYDAAYESYITDPEIPHSIYEIEGAREVAIEFRSFSKTAGFTGVRCALTVVPKDLLGRKANGETHPIHPLWSRRQSTKFNGVSYIVQRGAAAAYTPEGRAGPQTDRFLPRERPAAPRRLGSRGHRSLRRRECSLCVAEDARQPQQLGVLRPPARKRPSRRHAGQRFRSLRRRLFPLERLQQPGECPRSRAAVPKGGGVIRAKSRSAPGHHRIMILLAKNKIGHASFRTH